MVSGAADELLGLVRLPLHLLMDSFYGGGDGMRLQSVASLLSDEVICQTSPKSIHLIFFYVSAHLIQMYKLIGMLGSAVYRDHVGLIAYPFCIDCFSGNLR